MGYDNKPSNKLFVGNLSSKVFNKFIKNLYNFIHYNQIYYKEIKLFLF